MKKKKIPVMLYKNRIPAMMKKILNVKNVTQREINTFLRGAVKDGIKKITLKNVNGHRYIASGLRGKISITIEGTAGNDLGSFMDGPRIEVKGNAQDCVGNTMNDGKIIVRGSCGDIAGYGMRGGQIYVQGDVGYRAGIHMKAYKDLLPVIIVGGRVEDYFGEYLAGGILMVLNLAAEKSPVGKYLGTGMHGGTIYIRGKVEKYKLGKEIGVSRWSKEDDAVLKLYLKEYCGYFNLEFEKIRKDKFVKYKALSLRPYGKHYVY